MNQEYLKNNTLVAIQPFKEKCEEYYKKHNLINTEDSPRMTEIINGVKRKSAYLKMKIVDISNEYDNLYRIKVQIKTYINNKSVKKDTDILVYLDEIHELPSIRMGTIKYLYGIVSTGYGNYSQSLFYNRTFGLFTSDLYNDSKTSDFLTYFGGYIFDDDALFDDFKILNSSDLEYNSFNITLYYKDLKDFFKERTNKSNIKHIEEFSKTEYDKKLLDEITNNIDLVRHINQAKIHQLDERRELKFKEDGESKIYLLCNDKIIKTPYFLIKQSIEKGYLKYFEKSLIEIVNNRLNEISIMNGGPKKAIILKRFNLELEKINYEVEPDDSRSTVTAFALIDNDTHQFKTEDLFYKDLSISCYKNPHYKGVN